MQDRSSSEEFNVKLSVPLETTIMRNKQRILSRRNEKERGALLASNLSRPSLWTASVRYLVADLVTMR